MHLASCQGRLSAPGQSPFRDLSGQVPPGIAENSPFIEVIPKSVWRQDWVVHCQPVGSGLVCLEISGTLYLSSCDQQQPNFEAGRMGESHFATRPSDTGKTTTMTLSAVEFIRRFLQHVLPKGFVKIRYYGFFALLPARN